MKYNIGSLSRVYVRSAFVVGLAMAFFDGLPIARAEQSEKAAESRHGAAFVDPLGFLLFGPTLGVEVAAGPVSVILSGRWFNIGLLSHQLFLNEGEEFAFSYGAGLHGRYYFGPKLAGFFGGLGVEYLRSSIERPSALIVTKSQYLVPLVEGGYRYGWERFFVSGAAGVGYALELTSAVENLPGGNQAGFYQPLDQSSVYGTASLEVGVFF